MEKELELKRPASRTLLLGFISKGKGSGKTKSSALLRSPAPTSRVKTALRPMHGFQSSRVGAEPNEAQYSRHAMPMMKGNTAGMSEEQRTDYIAACDGKITWRQYFKKWGGLSL
jgi:hypothetical protein